MDNQPEQTEAVQTEEHPIREVYGGRDQRISPPDTSQGTVTTARELDPRDVAGLAYAEHGTEAQDENGEVRPVVVVHPVRVDGRNRRSDDDVLEGHACEIVEGDYKGRKGVFLSVVRHDPQSGYPTQVLVRTQENEYEHLSVPYSSIRPPKSLR